MGIKNIFSGSQSTTAWLLLGFLSLVWGSSFILIKKSLLALSPLQVGTGRVVIAFIAFIPLFIYQFKRINRKDLWPIVVVGICGSGIPAILYAIAQTRIPSGVAGLLNALTPIFTFALALLFFGKSFSRQQLIGICLGFGGTLLIFLTRSPSSAFPYLYGLLIVGATCCYGISANTVGRYLQSVNPLLISTLSFVAIGPFALIYLSSTDFYTQITQHPEGMISLWSLIILSLVGTFGANILFFRLIQITDPVFSSSVSFITPIVAMLWGLWDGEVIHLLHILALLLILIGVYIIKIKK